ncbi:ArsR/SmtB family transcription factor [Marinicella sp. W31]|uniref:ArsR/SmtB family transcription factor n=1 Tax=Marinicella sp. W31 TaxID=3023713 RepID=UPI0037574779
MNQDLQPLFRALADTTRRQILMRLSDHDMSIAEVAEQFDMSRTAVKKHLTILQQGQLISIKQQGRESINSIEPENLKPVSEWINHFSHFWDERLHQLKQAIEQETGE